MLKEKDVKKTRPILSATLEEIRIFTTDIIFRGILILTCHGWKARKELLLISFLIVNTG